MLTNLRNSLKSKIEKLKKKEEYTNKKNANLIKEKIKEIYQRFGNIKQNYLLNNNFQIIQMKSYFEELKSCHNIFLDLYKYFDKENKN